ncbi:Baeyer-Villiger monooxygenase [Colletotrichum sp. SAR11_240]|nr:Baeyer-Villiger monooxygenase [Colletotrichum sp. SAR11_240]
MPPQEELWRYLDHVARKYNLTNKMKFGVDVERCEWSEARQRWRMTIRRYSDDSIFTHECQFLFTATGQLMQPNPIDVPGAENFKGAIFHSSRWDTSVDIEGKKVVVFGNGCTATQLIPAIVDKVKHLTQVIRTKHWIMESVDSANTTFMKKVFGSVPGTMTIQRLLMFAWAEDSFRGFYMTDAGTRYRKRVPARVEKYMRATAPEKYHDKIIPDFELGCKRRVFDSGYLQSLHSENMTLMDDPVLEIVPEGIRTKDGIIEADVIVMCNGFVTNNAVGGLKVIGRGGETIDQHWESFGGAEAYNCTILNNFPNLFVLLGPNSLTGHTSAIIAAENSINFSLRIIKPLLDGKGTVVEVKRDAEEEYVQQMQRDMQDRVWYTGCNSWYLRGSKEGKKWNGSTYPYSQVYFLYRCLFPKFDDLQISIFLGGTRVSLVTEFDIGQFAAIASFLACILLCPLLFLEHSRSVRPSDLAIIYLLVSLACDATEFWLAYEGGKLYNDDALYMGIANLTLKFVLMFAGSRGKASILRSTGEQSSPEEVGGVLSRTFFWWINPILARGSKFVLSGDSLPSLHTELSSEVLRRRALRCWDQRAKPETKITLPRVLVNSLWSHFLAPVIPRLSLIIFRYAQPVLISTVIRYLNSSSVESSQTGYQLIFMASIVYVGLAVSSALYFNRLNRLQVMIRGALVGLINNKSLTQQSVGYDDAKAIMLMSTDAENVGQSARQFHETWAQIIEVFIGTVMLARQVGWVCVVPFVMIFCEFPAPTSGFDERLMSSQVCSRMSKYLAQNLQSKQKDWNEATQKRLAMTTSMLSSMKGLKMLGVTNYAAGLVQHLRKQELEMASRAIVIERVAIQPNASKPPIVSNVDLEVTRGSLVMCSGPVGCGKSALAKALIGELPVNSGTISLSSKRIGYCAQSPWLPGGTFKEAICGFLPQDQSWYEEVLQLCCLKEDLEGLSMGDQTMIGSRGLNLSGGQRQRVALARALYARCDIMLLDDSFSALDGKTERQIVDNLIGSEGYFKKAGVTAFIITNSTSYFKLADQLLILGNGSVTYKGTWDDLAQKPGEILKFNDDESHNQNSVQEVKMDKTVLKQKLKVEEGISDLSRAAGDFSLYGTPEIFKLIVQTALLFTAQKMMTLAFPLVVVAIYIVQRVYLPFSSRARLKNLEEQTPKEDKPGEDYVPKLPWPSAGVVEINDVTVAYNSEAFALRNVTIKVSGGQQFIICGRTGSGKSTLLLALLRLLDATSGSIKVDGVDLSLVPRSLIREDCFITVCQDPFILDQTSLRFNLNPISTVGWRGLADVLIIDVLQQTGLWSHFKSGESEITPSEAKDILDTPMSSLPQMSTGQTQLFALSRAILQKAMDGTEASVMGGRHPGKKILLLDEATASLDPETEAAMGRIIHEQFTAQGHTVIAISHRLGGLAENMREGRDAVALLSNGRIEKIGGVHEVLGTMVLES